MVTVRELCKKYGISHQAVYKKIARNKNQLEGHVYKNGCFMLDDYAADFLKPKTADTKFFEESEKLKDELARKNIELDFLESDNRRLTSENEKIANLKNSLNDKTAEIEIFKNQLSLTNKI